MKFIFGMNGSKAIFARGSRPDCQKTALKTLKLACLDMHVLRFMRKVDSSETFFVVVFLVLNLFTDLQRVSNSYFKENYTFPSLRGSNIFQGGGGVQLFPGGSKCLFL